jgi:tyrosyl-tRNA synthetase
VPSKSEARRNISQGGIIVNNEKVSDISHMVTRPDFVIQKGKKVFLKVNLG